MNTSPNRFPHLVPKEELRHRGERRIRTSLTLSALPTGQTLANFDFAFQPSVERSRIETLATCQWIRENRTLLIQGPPGVGKTHLSVALGVKAVEHGFGVMFYRLEELLGLLRRDADLSPARLRRKKYLYSSLLIIDEVGFDPMTRQEASLFFRLVSHRYQRGSILITTNKGIRAGPRSWPVTRSWPPPSWIDSSTTATCSTSWAGATDSAISSARSRGPSESRRGGTPRSDPGEIVSPGGSLEAIFSPGGTHPPPPGVSNL